MSEYTKLMHDIRNKCFDYENSAKYLITEASYHFRKNKVDDFLKTFLKAMSQVYLPPMFNYSDEFIKRIINDDVKFEEVRALQAYNRNFFIPVIIGDEFISIYQFWTQPAVEMGFSDSNTVEISKKHSTGVIGFSQTYKGAGYEEISTFYNIMFAKKGEMLSTYRSFSPRKNELSLLGEYYSISEEVKDIEEKGPLEVIDKISGLLNISMTYPSNMEGYKLEKEKGLVKVFSKY